MGVAGSKDAFLSPKRLATLTEGERNKLIDKELRRQNAANRMKVKLLLLGAGDSGKSTLFKQMKIHYGQTFNDYQLKTEKERILMTVFEGFTDLLRACNDNADLISGWNIKVSAEDQAAIDEAMTRIVSPNKTEIQKRIMWVAEEGQEMQEELARILYKAWKTELVQKVWTEVAPADAKIPSSLAHFCDKILDYTKPRYTPTMQDYLLARIRTVGILEQGFVYKGVPFSIIDVGGQKNERKKWIQCFEGVTSVIFVAAISDFDQTLFEDITINRLKESIELFRVTSENLVFRKLPFILFLNKCDLLKEKLGAIKARSKDLDEYFPELGLGKDFEPDDAYEKIKNLVSNKFQEVAPWRTLHTHFVTAIDDDIFLKVFNSSVSIVLMNALSEHFAISQP